MANTADMELEAQQALYDLGYHLRGDLAEDAVSGEVASLKKALESAGAKIVYEREPVATPLAYTISRMTKGKREDFDTAYFGTLLLEGGATTVEKTMEVLTGNPALIRFLLLKTTQQAAEETMKLDKPKQDEGEAVLQEELDKTIEALTA